MTARSHPVLPVNIPPQADTGEVLRHRRSPAITDEHLAVLGSLTSLTGLHLSHVTHVTGTGLAHLHRLTGLEALSLGSALDAHAVSGADLTALGNALPRLHSLHIGCLAAAHQLLDVGLAFVQPPPIAVLGATAGKQPGSRRGHHAGPPVPPNGALLGVTAALPLGGLAALAPPPVAHGELKAWGACLTHFSALHTLGLQLTSSLEPEVRLGLCVGLYLYAADCADAWLCCMRLLCSCLARLSTHSSTHSMHMPALHKSLNRTRVHGTGAACPACMLPELPAPLSLPQRLATQLLSRARTLCHGHSRSCWAACASLTTCGCLTWRGWTCRMARYAEMFGFCITWCTVCCNALDIMQ